MVGALAQGLNTKYRDMKKSRNKSDDSRVYNFLLVVIVAIAFIYFMGLI